MKDDLKIPDRLDSSLDHADTALGGLVRIYSGNAFVQAALKLLPYWGSADAFIQRKAAEVRKQELTIFFKELADGTRDLTEDNASSQEFLYCYFHTLKAVSFTRRKEKLRMLARLLAEAARDPELAASDRYDEFVAALDAISARELRALRVIREFEQQFGEPTLEGQPHLRSGYLEYWRNVREALVDRIGLTAEETGPFLARLERTGFYLRITGSFYSYTGDIGRTTVFFHDLLTILADVP